MSKYDAAVKLVAEGATYREALVETGLTSIGWLHTRCERAGVKPRPKGRRRFVPESAKRGARLVRNGMTYRAAAEVTGAHISQIHKAVHRGER